jgi:probable phosphoglycerate mutase
MLPAGRTLYLIRHGETDWNAEGRLQGGRDIPLNDLGRVQAEEAARRLATVVAQPEDLAWVVSPMTRARETAEIARQSLGLHPSYFKVDERLREITFGQWEGLTWREVKAQDRERARQREKDKWFYVPPGGESYEMLTARVAAVFDSLDRDSLLISHGGVMRAALAYFGFERRETASGLEIWQGRVMVMTATGWRWV